MPPVQIQIEAEINPLVGKNSRMLNKILKDKVLPIVIKEVTVDIADRAEQYARGIDLPPHITNPQADHKVGQSKSGYVSTGKLADSIQVRPTSKWGSLIEALEHYASYVEFGTYGGRSPGQPPQPFFRGSIWFIKDNINLTVAKIQSKLRSIK